MLSIMAAGGPPKKIFQAFFLEESIKNLDDLLPFRCMKLLHLAKPPPQTIIAGTIKNFRADSGQGNRPASAKPLT